MILVDADRVSMTRPGRPLFTDLSVTVSAGDRIGLVGLNGSGKSSLLAVLAGTVEPESGRVRHGRGVRIAVLEQQPELGSGSVRDAMRSLASEAWEIEAVLDRLGMTSSLDAAVADLSGGEAKRVALARALVQPCDLLVLDEPTNHLDIEAIGWLEDRLAEFAGGLVLVTHDRHVLDRVTTRVVELDRGAAHVHDGGYAAYLDGRSRREEAAQQAERVRRNQARTELAWLRRGAPARTSKAKARIRSAVELVDRRPPDPARTSNLDLHFGTPRLGNDVIELDAVSFSHPGTEALLEDVHLALDRRERLGVVGANGSGKSTLLALMAGRLRPSAGRVRVGSTAVVQLFDQHGVDLDPARRVWEVVVGEDGGKPDWRDKALMERFWFDADAQFAPVELLSGGERRRLQLLVALARRPNVLLLDEPTNDLDLDTLRSLEEFLEEFRGAVVVVSHDRAFLERTVDDVIVLDGTGTAGRVAGGYEAYVELLRQRSRRVRPAPQARHRTGPPHPQRRGRSKSTIRHELRQTERAIADLELRRAELEAEVGTVGVDHVVLASASETLAVVAADLNDAEERWLRLSEELED